MPHRNAPLTETGRLRLARCVVEEATLRRVGPGFFAEHTLAEPRVPPRGQ